jgi:RNA polymerase sigma-70 factor (ECF subfamily)
MRSGESGDADLVSKLQRRDPDGLAAAYDRYGQMVYSLFLRMTQDPSTAEDLVQELFLRVWNRSRDFDATKGSLGIWILSIARNLGLDFVRSARHRFKTRLQPLDKTDELRLSYKPKEPASLIDSARLIKEAFANLTTDQKRVLELAYFEGFSQSEIAAQLNAPLGTVKSWMRAALERLRMALKPGEVR